MRMRFWIKNGSLAKLWISVFLFLRYDTPDWPGLARGGRTVRVVVGVLKGLWDLTMTFCHYSKPV